MACKTVIIFTTCLLALALCAPAQNQDQKVDNEKEDLQTAASHWGGFGHYGGYGHYGHGYYPHYGYGYGYGWGWPGYGYYYGGYPYGYYGHGYWW